MTTAAFGFDTSAFVDAWRRFYPKDVFEKLFSEIDKRIDAGDIVASDEVKVELEQKDDDILAYVKTKPGLFLPVDDEQQDHVTDILSRYPQWIDPAAKKNNADPFAVALGKSKGLTVVSFERNGGAKKPKIPFVCQEFGVDHLHYTDLLRKLGLKF